MSTAPEAPPRERYESLNALRGLVALVIVVFHFPHIFFGAELSFIRHSYVFTNMYFALSGFLMMAVYGDRLASFGKYGSFFKGRFLRLYPLHVFTMVTVILSPWLAWLLNQGISHLVTGTSYGGLPPLTVNWGEVAGDLLMLQGFGLFDSLHLNFPSWAMSVLLISTLLFGLIATVFHRHPLVRDSVFLLLFLAGLVSVWMLTPKYIGATYDYGLMRCFASFFLGALVFRARQALNLPGRVGQWAVAWQSAAVVLVLGFITIVGIDTERSMLAPFIFALFVLAFSFDKGDYAALLRTRIPQWLGERSFSIYLNQATLLFIGLATQYWVVERFAMGEFEVKLFGTFSLAVFVVALLYWSDWTYRNIELRFTASRRKRAEVRA